MIEILSNINLIFEIVAFPSSIGNQTYPTHFYKLSPTHLASMDPTLQELFHNPDLTQHFLKNKLFGGQSGSNIRLNTYQL